MKQEMKEEVHKYILVEKNSELWEIMEELKVYYQ